MKKTLACLLVMLTLFTAAATSAEACHRRGYARRSYSRVSHSRSYSAYNRRTVYYVRDRRSFWDKHRDKLTVALGTGSGAGLGALIGGRRGAAIGALAGGGGSALYTYGLRNRHPRYRRY
jgi:hypothetical protein